MPSTTRDDIPLVQLVCSSMTLPVACFGPISVNMAINERHVVIDGTNRYMMRIHRSMTGIPYEFLAANFRLVGSMPYKHGPLVEFKVTRHVGRVILSASK